MEQQYVIIHQIYLTPAWILHAEMTDIQFYSPAFIPGIICGDICRKLIQSSYGEIWIGGSFAKLFVTTSIDFIKRIYFYPTMENQSHTH